MKYSHVCIATLALIVAATLDGCAEFPYVDQMYGQAYLAMVRDQTFKPRAARVAHRPAPGGGMRLENVLKAHRGAVSQAVASHIRTGRFETGGGGGG